jgi:hypothetical protein
MVSSSSHIAASFSKVCGPSSHTTESAQQETTKSLLEKKCAPSKRSKGKFSLSKKRWIVGHTLTKGLRFGSWEVLSDVPFRLYGNTYVQARCGCGTIAELHLVNAEKGKTLGCRACASRRLHKANGHLVVTTLADKQLQKRVNAMRQRCQNPNDKNYHNYGGRGIEFRFASVKAGVDYILSALPAETYVGVDLDRIDNNGHYEPGNLQLLTRQENLRNRRSMIFLTPVQERAFVLGMALYLTANTALAKQLWA